MMFLRAFISLAAMPLGRTVWKDGDVYEGDYVRDVRHGHGIYRWADG